MIWCPFLGTDENLVNSTKMRQILDVDCCKFCIYRTRAIITRGLYTFYPLFEVHLCTVTFGLMYG